MEQSFVKNNVNIPAPFPLSLYREELYKLLQFYSDKNSRFCFLEGKTGSGKTDLFDFSQNYLNENVLIFKFKCFEGTTLDDIFLSFFEDLKRYSQQKKISFTKIETKSLSTRINTYLNHINVPCVIFVDSVENVFNKKNTAEKEEIIAYIEHLNSMNKFKIVAASAYFDDSFSIDNFSRIVLHPFEKEQVEEYFNNYSIKYTDSDLEKFLEITRGNIAYVKATANLILTLNTTLSNLLEEYSKKKISYEDFMLQKVFTLIPDNVKKPLHILSAANIGISAQYLIHEKFFTQDNILYMIDKDILTEENGLIFLKSNIKKYLQSSVAHYERIKIHTFWRDFYTSQLPVKPNNRAVLISRNTMRSQIEYHSSFIMEQRPKEKEHADMSLMSYLNSNLTAWNIKNTNAKEETPDDDKKRPIPPKSLQKNNPNFEKYELTKEEISLLSVPVDLRKQEEKTQKERMHRTLEQREEEMAQRQKEKSLKSVFAKAQELETLHDFETAYTLYCSLLSLKTDSDFYEYEPSILENLAACCRKMNRTTDAIDFYNKLTELYTVRNQEENVNKTKLKIAAIYKETYKINHARVIFENFINKKTPASNNIIARSYLELAEIEEDLSNTDKAVEYYKKAFSLVDENLQMDKNYLAQAYFKYALILDDYNQTQAALDFYQRSIRTADDSCVYKSASYTNIAQIMQESGNFKKASDYYKMGLKTDIQHSNYEGVYYICLKLAGLYDKTDSQKTLDWLLKSLSAAKRTKEQIYVTNAYIELGDYYSQCEQNVKALKSYLLAERNLENIEQQAYTYENKSAILARISDLKKKIPLHMVEKIEKEINRDA